MRKLRSSVEVLFQLSQRDLFVRLGSPLHQMSVEADELCVPVLLPDPDLGLRTVESLSW